MKIIFILKFYDRNALVKRRRITPAVPLTEEMRRVAGFIPISKPVKSERRFTANRREIPEAEERKRLLKKCLLRSIIMSIIIENKITSPKTALFCMFILTPPLYKYTGTKTKI